MKMNCIFGGNMKKISISALLVLFITSASPATGFGMADAGSESVKSMSGERFMESGGRGNAAQGNLYVDARYDEQDSKNSGLAKFSAKRSGIAVDVEPPAFDKKDDSIGFNIKKRTVGKTLGAGMGLVTGAVVGIAAGATVGAHIGALAGPVGLVGGACLGIVLGAAVGSGTGSIVGQYLGEKAAKYF